MRNPVSRRYQLKRALLWPRTLLLRWKYRACDARTKALLEHYYYRTAVFDFTAAIERDPELLHAAAIDSDCVVVTVGAGSDGWVRHMVERYDPVIYAFEPAAQAFAALREMAGENPKLQPMPYGLGWENTAREHGMDEGRTLPETTGCVDPDPRRTEVPVAQVWRDLKLGQVDLMRIAAGGAAYSLLDEMIRVRLLNRVSCFIIHFHEPHPGAYQKRLRIREELSKTHRLEWDYDFIWEKWVRF